MDLRPSIHARKSERLKFSLSKKPEKKDANLLREKNVRKAEYKNKTPKPCGFFEKPAKIVFSQSQKNT